MLNKIAYGLLALTSMVPSLVVYGFSQWSHDHVKATIVAVSVSVFLVLVCSLTMSRVRKEGEHEQAQISKSKRLDKDVLAFLVAYALPIVTRIDKPGDVAALLAFAFIFWVVLIQLQIVHVNPLLALMGWHFFDVTTEPGDSALLITKNASMRPGLVQIKRLSSNVWIEFQEDSG